MKKLAIILCLSFFALLSTTSEIKAQESYGTGGVDLLVPVSDEAFTDFTSFGFGLNLGYELGLSDKLGVNFHVGFLNYVLDEDFRDFFSIYHIPLQVGARYYLDESRSGLFLGAKVGTHISLTVPDEGDSESETYLSVAPEVGFFLTDNISLGLRYQAIFIPEDEDIGQEAATNSYIGLTGAFNF